MDFWLFLYSHLFEVIRLMISWSDDKNKKNELFEGSENLNANNVWLTVDY